MIYELVRLLPFLLTGTIRQKNTKGTPWFPRAPDTVSLAPLWNSNPVPFASIAFLQVHRLGLLSGSLFCLFVQQHEELPCGRPVVEVVSSFQGKVLIKLVICFKLIKYINTVPGRDGRQAPNLTAYECQSWD